jgi:glycosyltransferase involved in cell wall biosynthesis
LIEVGVVIPAYNAEAFLGETLDSVLRQTLQPAKVIVVDDGSHDGTASVARRFGGRVALVSQQNRGVAEARNVGAAHAGTEWLAFLDADDVWLPGKLERQASLAKSGRQAVFCAIQTMDREGRPLPFRSGPVDLGLAALLRHSEGIPQGSSSTLVVRRDLFDAVGRYDSRLATMADWDLMLRLRLAGPFGYVDEPLVLYRRHGSNMSRNVPMLERESGIVLAKAFAHPGLPAELQGLRRSCFAWNDLVLAGSYFWAGDRLAALRHGAKALRGDPSLLGHLAGFPLRVAARALRREPHPGSR